MCLAVNCNNNDTNSVLQLRNGMVIDLLTFLCLVLNAATDPGSFNNSVAGQQVSVKFILIIHIRVINWRSDLVLFAKLENLFGQDLLLEQI